MDTEVLDPNLVESMAADGRISIAVMPQADGGNNIVLTVADAAIDTAQLAINAVETDNIVDANVTLVKLAGDVTLSSLPAPTTTVSWNNQRLADLADPTDARDAANMGYVDAADTALDTRITAIEDEYLVSAMHDVAAGTLTITDQNDSDLVVPLGSGLNVNATNVDDPNLQDGDFITYTVTGSNIVPTLPNTCLLYTSPSPRDRTRSRMPSSA